jgi:hypothetical protein
LKGERYKEIEEQEFSTWKRATGKHREIQGEKKK